MIKVRPCHVKTDWIRRVRLYLVGERKFFRCRIGCFVGCQKEFSDTNKKTNYIARLETVRQIY
jgi:hypothetical protein